MTWLSKAFVAMASISIMILLIKQLTRMKIKPEIINLYFFLFTTIAFAIFTLARKTQFKLPPNSIPIFLLLATISVVYNYYIVSAISSAPNPGYVEAINSFRVIFITLAAFIFFDSEITTTKLIGITLSLGGLILISL